MKTLKYICLLVIGFELIMGCSGDKVIQHNEYHF